MNQYLVVSAIAPSLLLMWYFHKRDVFPEPGRVLWTTFGLGVLTVIPVLLTAGPASLLVDMIPGSVANGAATAFLLAAVPEEFFKFLVLVLYASRHKEFDEPMDGIVYGVAASLGFATLENVMYVASSGGSAAIMRAVTAVPAHCFWGAIMGYYVGQARFAPAKERGRLWAMAYLAPMLLHGLYDFPLLAISHAKEHGVDVGAMAFTSVLAVPAIVIFCWVFSVKQVRRLRKDQLVLLAAQKAGDVPESTTIPVFAGSPAPVLSAMVARAQVRHTTSGVSWVGWALLLMGGLAGSFGGLVTLGVIAGIAMGAAEQNELGAVLVGAVVIGGLPLILGLVLFWQGLKRLNSKPAAAVA